MSFVILTSKPGKYRTEVGDGLDPVASYDYLLGGRLRAEFVIARLDGEVRVRVVDEAGPPIASDVPSKFLTKYETVEQAMAELRHLTAFGGMDTELRVRR